jgi:AcrR family transcriptional regulator
LPTLREQHQARTRELLLDAAAELFAHKGFRATTLGAIADAAGASTGAVYANFAGKEDLFIAVLERHMERQVRFYTESFAAGGGDLQSRARSGADTWVDLVASEPTYFPLFVEAWRHALEDAKFRTRFVETTEALVSAIKRMVLEGFAQDDAAVAEETAGRIALVIFGLANGLAMQKIVDPTAVPDELFGDALEAGTALLAQFALPRDG